MAPSELKPAALLLVDIQYDFLPPTGSLAVSSGLSILPPTYRLLTGSFSLFTASQDFHPPSHISFASRHSLPPFTSIPLPSPSSPSSIKNQELWPDHCVQGTHGAELEAGVRERLEAVGGVIVQKGTDREEDAYSAFAVPKGEEESRLVRLYKEAGIEEVYVVGLATDYCVRASALAALEAASPPWKVFVVREGVKGVDPEASERVLEELEKAGAELISIDGPELAPRLA